MPSSGAVNIPDELSLLDLLLFSPKSAVVVVGSLGWLIVRGRRRRGPPLPANTPSCSGSSELLSNRPLNMVTEECWSLDVLLLLPPLVFSTVVAVADIELDCCCCCCCCCCCAADFSRAFLAASWIMDLAPETQKHKKKKKTLKRVWFTNESHTDIRCRKKIM